MGKPYSDLEKRAIAILAGGGNPATSQDTAIANYWKWKINPSSSDHKLPIPSLRTTGRKKSDVALNPFGADLAANIFAKAQITKRTNDAMPANLKTACAYKALSGSDGQALRLRGYKPAYVYWRTGEATTSEQRTSRVTKRPYKSYYKAEDDGYLAPFGQSVATDTEGDRQKAIKLALPNINLVTFTPERYRE